MDPNEEQKEPDPEPSSMKNPPAKINKRGRPKMPELKVSTSSLIKSLRSSLKKAFECKEDLVLEDKKERSDIIRFKLVRKA